MWVAKYRKDSSYYSLWNRKPYRVNKICAITDGLHNSYNMNIEFDSMGSDILIPDKYNYMFEGKEFPIEVELIRDDKNPMFFVQKILDCTGNPNVYLDTRLEYHYKTENDGYIMISRNKPHDYIELQTCVNTNSSSIRIRPKEFECSVEEGCIPVSLKIK